MNEPTKLEFDAREGQVLLRFSRPVQELLIPPDFALPLFKRGVEAAKDLGARDDDVIHVAKELFSPIKDAALVKRLSLLLANMLEKGRSPEYIAKEFIYRVRERGA